MKKLILLFVLATSSLFSFLAYANCTTRTISTDVGYYTKQVGDTNIFNNLWVYDFLFTIVNTHCHGGRVHRKRQARRDAASAAAQALASHLATTVDNGTFVNHIPEGSCSGYGQSYFGRTWAKAETGLAGTGAGPWYYWETQHASAKC